mgnify:CR=1 FL=1
MNILLDLISVTSFIIIILSVFQTIVGVGILVLGTPILLLLGLEMINVMIILLPLSILNSLMNISYLRYKFNKINIDSNMRSYFIFICFPGIFFGLFILKILNDYLNFNFLVALVIWLFVIATYVNKKKNLKFSKKVKKILIFLIGIIHGITNSGGSLLSMLIVNTYSKNLNFIRFQIIFFYFFLALFHYFSVMLIFNFNFLSELKFTYVLSLLIGIIIGNIISSRINISQLRNIILALAFTTSIFLVAQA